MKKTLCLLLLVLSTMTAFCACKSGTDVKEGQKGNDPSVYYGGKITVGITQDLDSLDPHKAVAAGTKEVLINIFEGLIRVSSDGRFIPAVASSYAISPDGLTYSFELREEVKFHNGKEVTADDVIYSLKRVAGMLETSDPEVSIISAFSCFSAVNKTEKGIEVVLKEANTELMGYFTTAIIPCDYDQQASSPVGTGPFKFVSYEPLTKIVLEKNENYYEAGVPYLDGVTFKICANADSAMLELLGKSIDIFPYLTSDQVMQLTNDFEALDGTMNLVQALFLNNAFEPFSDIRVRQAICYALDRRAIIDMVAGGKGTVIGTNMFPSFARYFDDSLTDYYTTDVEKAKSLLTEAGYGDGLSFTITVPSNYDFHVRTAQVMVEQLKKAGIDAKIRLVEWSTWLSDVYAGRQYEATVIGLDSKLAPSDVLRFYPSASSKNFVNYFNDAFDQVYNLAVTETNEAQKAEYYKQLEAMLTHDAASAYIQSPSQLVAVEKHVKGYTFYPIFVQDMRTVYIEK